MTKLVEDWTAYLAEQTETCPKVRTGKSSFKRDNRIALLCIRE